MPWKEPRSCCTESPTSVSSPPFISLLHHSDQKSLGSDKESANCRLEANYAHQQDVDMIPLLMEQGYKAKGWLGLILGTRMYYAFHEDAVATDEAFTRQIDALTREIGDRGKPAEGVPPASRPPAPAPAPTPTRARARAPAATPAPAPEPAPAPAPPPARAALAAPEPSFSPSMQMTPAPALVSTQPQVSSIGLVELSDFLKEQRAEMKGEMESQRAAMAAEMDKQLARQREELTPREAVSAEQLASLQERLEQLHAAKLLADDELFVVEDLCADYMELQASVPNGGSLTQDMIYTAVGHSHSAAAKLHKLVRLSDGMASDAAFARQLKRKFV